MVAILRQETSGASKKDPEMDPAHKTRSLKQEPSNERRPFRRDSRTGGMRTTTATTVRIPRVQGTSSYNRALMSALLRQPTIRKHVGLAHQDEDAQTSIPNLRRAPTLRVIWSIFGVCIRNHNLGLGHILHIWVVGPHDSLAC